MSKQTVRPAALFLFLTAVAAAALSTVAIAAGPRTGGPAARPAADPVAFLEGVIRQIARNDYASAWLTLNPAQQRAVPQDEYVRCELLSPIPGRLDWIKAVRVSSERLVIPGGSAKPVLTKAVTFRLKLSQPSLNTSVLVTHVVHAVPAGRRWTWILPASRFELHRSGACLDGSAPEVRG